MALKKLSIVILLTFLLSLNAFADDLIVGFYAFPNKHFIDLIAGSKLNYIIVYGIDGTSEKNIKEFLDYADEKGVKIIFSLKDCYKTSKWYPKIDWCPTNSEKELVKCIVSKVDKYPSVVGYYLTDDATDTIGKKNLEIFKTHIKNIKLTSSKPVFVNDYPPPRGKLLEVFDDTADYLIVGIYPIPDEPAEKVYSVIKTVVDNYKKPIIALIQAHGKYQYPFYRRDQTTGRPPTLAELEKMTNLVIKAGAQGVVYYSLFDIEKLPDGKERLIFLKKMIEKVTKNRSVN